MFIIHDKILNEITGKFQTYNEALFFYMEKNFMERLKLFRHHLLNSETLANDIIRIRIVEDLMEQTYEILNGENINYSELHLKLNYGVSLLNNFKLPITMNIIYFDDDNKRRLNLAL